MEKEVKHVLIIGGRFQESLYQFFTVAIMMGFLPSISEQKSITSFKGMIFLTMLPDGILFYANI